MAGTSKAYKSQFNPWQPLVQNSSASLNTFQDGYLNQNLDHTGEYWSILYCELELGVRAQSERGSSA
jgi:hypothetical protein